MPRSDGWFHSANTDPELRDWLRFQSENGSNFTRALVESAMMAEVVDYTLLRPALVALRARYPEPNSTMVTLHHGCVSCDL
jgi:hypothetical protein